jgi:hypothetical protein
MSPVLTRYKARSFAEAYAAKMTGEPQGQAALLFCESLIHVLVEEKVLTLRQALSVLTTAVEVKADMVGLEDTALVEESMRLLMVIAQSLATKDGGSVLVAVE